MRKIVTNELSMCPPDSIATVEIQAAELYRSFFDEAVENTFPLKAHASSRCLFRIVGASGNRAVVAYNTAVAEDDAFESFTCQFRSRGLRVPEIFARRREQGLVMMQDLGDVTLYDIVTQDGMDYPSLISCYQRALDCLVDFQFATRTPFDFSLAYPRKAFDRDSMISDFRYFERDFAERVGMDLGDGYFKDVERLCDWLAQAPSAYFMYRDFQSRNIMVVDGEYWFIDYQSGRQGPLAYDVASLLYQSRVALPQSLRESLVEYYISQVSERSGVARSDFIAFFPGMVVLRHVQVLATYGKLGLGDRNPMFLNTIPAALSNLASVINSSYEFKAQFPGMSAKLASPFNYSLE